MRLNQGEMMMHYRYRQGRPSACGDESGSVTSVLAEVGCPRCRAVARLAIKLAGECGCHSGQYHAPVARAQIEAGH